MRLLSVRSQRWLTPGLSLAGLIALWQLVCSVFDVPTYLLPTPLDVFRKAISIRASLLEDTAITAIEAALGFVVGSAFGVTLGCLCGLSKIARLVIVPYAIALKTVPIIAIAPLLVIWFGTDVLPKAILAGLICFFPVLIGTVQGLTSPRTEELDLFRSMAATKWQEFRWLRWPSALPFVFAALRIAVVFAVIGAIVAEFAGADGGIGFKILLASFHVDTPAMFVHIVVSALLSMVLYALVAIAEPLTVPWTRNVAHD